MPLGRAIERGGFVIALRSVSKIYESGQTIALKDVHLSIEPGEFITVVGPSGCGKTTLLQLLAGFEQSTEGAITILNEPIQGPSPERAVVFQQPTLLPWMNVEDNITYGLRLQGSLKSMHRDEICDMLRIMGLLGFEKHKVYHLSGGMQQRVAIARALITKPAMILMDEPFGALDAMTREELQLFLLHTWKQLRPTILFITHDIDEAILLGTRVLVMSPRPGRIAKDIAVPFDKHDEDITTSDAFIDLKRQVFSLLHPRKIV
jgi:NitT/TauT family transport system ATP-binding protein